MAKDRCGGRGIQKGPPNLRSERNRNDVHPQVTFQHARAGRGLEGDRLDEA